MRSMKICSAMIYFMAKGERLNREHVFGQKGNPVYAIWPEMWVSLAFIPPRSEGAAFSCAIGHYYKNY